MKVEPVFLLSAVAIGFATGLTSGAFGVGGGLLSTPLLRHLLGASAHVALGTTLALIVPTAIAGALNYLRRNLVAWQLARACAPPAVLGTILGSLATMFVHGQILMLLVAALIAFTGFDFISGFGQRFRPAAAPDTGALPAMTALDCRNARLVGLAAGFLSGFLGLGGGILMVPCFCYLFRTSIKVAFGTSLLLVALVSIPGTVVHALAGHVNAIMALCMILGSLPGAWLGSSIALRLKESWLRKAFGVLLVGLSVVFAWRELTELLKLER